MSTLSVVLIVKNEAHNLDACLQTANFADEIIVLDSGSNDNTLSVAKRYTDKVFTDEHWQGYGKQRQKAHAYATTEWILMLDADERITPELQQSITNAVNNNQPTNVYALPRLSFCFGSAIRHCGWYPDWVVRLYAKERANWNDAGVHEQLTHQLNVVKLSGDLHHYTYQNIHHYLVKSAHYARDWANDKHTANKSTSLTQATLHALACFIKMYLIKRGFLDGKQGFLLCLLSAHSTFAKYAALWDKNNNESQV